MRKSTPAYLILLAILFALVFSSLPASPALAGACRASHTVRSGETLKSIATRYDVSIDELTKANRLYAPHYTIYVLQTLCIPSGAKPFTSAPSYANSPAADFTARIQNNSLVISTTNFPKTSGYYVKAGPVGTRPSTKIGLFNTAKGGSLRFNFALPDKLSKPDAVTVCLKNNVTDANICRTAKR